MPLHVQSDIQFGTVKCYKDDRGFGFIRPDQDKKDIFFHAKGRGEAVLDAGRNGGYQADLYLARAYGSEDPVTAGSRLCFIVDPIGDGRGPQAKLWTFEHLWKEAEAGYEEPKFLVIRRYTVNRRHQWVQQAPETVFRGTFDELVAKYPRGTDDHLKGTNSPQVKTSYSFAEMIDGTWQPCVVDPRPRTLG